MNINEIHNFNNLDINKFKKIQNELKKQITINTDIDTSDINICAGVDSSYWTYNNETYGVCSIVLLDFKTKKVINKYESFGKVSVDYISGFLAFRELPLILETARKIKEDVDIFIFDGNGILHPREMGIATHASFFLNKPTIGVAKSYLKINNSFYDEPKNKKGSYKEIKINNKIKGVAYRCHTDTNPIFISIGNYIDLKTSIKCVEMLIDKDSKLPLPTRYANIETHLLRKKYKNKRL